MCHIHTVSGEGFCSKLKRKNKLLDQHFPKKSVGTQLSLVLGFIGELSKGQVEVISRSQQGQISSK